MLTPQEFYRDTQVLRRILEYCGVPAEETAEFNLERDLVRLNDSNNLRELTKKMTVEYVCGWGEYFLKTKGKRASSRKPVQLGELLDGGLNLFRSIWDKQKITFVLDIEYVSYKFPGESYLRAEDTFMKLEPVYWCFWDIFKEFGIKPLTLATGQGYHFVLDVNSYDKPYWDSEKKVTDVANQIVEIGHLEKTLQGKYQFLPPRKKRDRVIEPELGKAFDACGRLLEYIVHKAMEKLPVYKPEIPLSIGDTIAGNDKQETINCDLSTYASPLYVRPMRTAFSIHDKHHDPKKDVGAGHIPIQIAIPRHTPCNGNTLNLEELFINRRHFRNSANYAAAITTNIPEAPVGMAKLIEEYKRSSLYRFHQDFDKTRSDDPSQWGYTYDKFNLNEVPPCVAKILSEPYPALLQPTQLQTLVRVLTGKKWWHPKHVAGLVRSKYERGYNWNFNWFTYDANHFANTWVRFYAGLLATGRDQKTDLNCVSHQEKGLCVKTFCGYNLEGYK